MNPTEEVQFAFDTNLSEVDVTKSYEALGYDPEFVTKAIEEQIVEDNLVMDDMGNDLTEIIDHSEFLRQAANTQDTLERTVDVVATKLGSSQDADLSRAAIESLKYVMNYVRDSIGLEKSAIQPLAALEAFDDSSPTAKRDTSLKALEALKESLNGLWEGVKKAAASLWEKIREFWGKHVSTLGRLQKEIKRTAKKVQGITGSPDFSKGIKIPGSMSKAFAGQGDLKGELIVEYLGRQKDVTKVTIELAKKFTKEMHDLSSKTNVTSTDVEMEKLKDGKLKDDGKSADHEIGTEQKPLIQSFYGEVKITTEGEGIKVTFDKKQANIETSNDRKIELASANVMTSVLNAAWDLCEETISLGKDYEQQHKEFTKAMNTVDTFVKRNEKESGTKTNPNASDAKTAGDKSGTEDKGGGAANKADAAKALSIRFRNLANVSPTINSKISSLNLTAMREAIKFCDICIKNYNHAGGVK